MDIDTTAIRAAHRTIDTAAIRAAHRTNCICRAGYTCREMALCDEVDLLRSQIEDARRAFRKMDRLGRVMADKLDRIDKLCRRRSIFICSPGYSRFINEVRSLLSD
jgi:hypothetical protein